MAVSSSIVDNLASKKNDDDVGVDDDVVDGTVVVSVLMTKTSSNVYQLLIDVSTHNKRATVALQLTEICFDVFDEIQNFRSR